MELNNTNKFLMGKYVFIINLKYYIKMGLQNNAYLNIDFVFHFL